MKVEPTHKVLRELGVTPPYEPGMFLIVEFDDPAPPGVEKVEEGNEEYCVQYVLGALRGKGELSTESRKSPGTESRKSPGKDSKPTSA